MPNYCSNNLTLLNGEDIRPYIEQYLIQTGDPDGEINLDFPIIQKLSKLIGESLRLTYLEEGMGFCGEYIANPDGTYSDKVYDDLENVPDDLKEELGLIETEEDEEE